MRGARRAAKFAATLGALGLFTLEAALLPLRQRDPWRRRRSLAVLTQRWSRRALALLGVKVELEGGLRGPGNALIVSNHLSYVDILVLASQRPSCFVTSLDMAETPGLGLVLRSAGCIFVDRKRLRSLGREVREVAQALERGLDVALFPEATSTDGRGVKTFKRLLYQSAVASRRPVQPVCLLYESVDGRPLDLANRDRVFWYGDMTFLPHLWELCSCREVRVRLAALDALPSEGADAAALARCSHERVRARYVPVAA